MNRSRRELLRRRSSGQAAAEWIIVIALIVVAVVIVMLSIKDRFGSVSNGMTETVSEFDISGTGGGDASEGPAPAASDSGGAQGSEEKAADSASETQSAPRFGKVAGLPVWAWAIIAGFALVVIVAIVKPMFGK